MAAEGEVTRTYAHEKGVACLTFSSDGEFIITAGSEGLVRCWRATSRDTPQDLEDDTLPGLTSLACYEQQLAVADEEGQVSLYAIDATSGSLTFAEYVTRTNMQTARAVAFNPAGTKVAIASDELIVKIVDVEDNQKVTLLTGHTKGVREVSWSPDGHYLTTSGCDGTIRVWDTTSSSSSEPTCVKVLDGVIPTVTPDSTEATGARVEAVWHPSGKFFVVVNRTNEVAIYDGVNWTKFGVYDDAHSAPITSLSFSASGKYLASASSDGKIVVRDAVTKKVVASHQGKPNASVLGIAFSPLATVNLLAWVDGDGELVRWNDVIPSGLKPAGVEKKNSSEVMASSQRKSEGESLGADSDNEGGGGEEDDDDDDAESIGVDSLFGDPKARKGEADSEADDDGADLEGWIDDDDVEDAVGEDGMPADPDALKRQRDRERERQKERLMAGKGLSKAPAAPSASRLSKDSLKAVGKAEGFVGALAIPKGMEPLMPGSTPWKDRRRYLAFNTLGTINVVDRDEFNIVTVEFHDAAGQRTGFHFNDHHKFSLGAMGELGCIFASQSTSKAAAVSTLFYRPYDSWAHVQDWTYTLPAGESATLLAVGGMEEPEEEDGVGIAGSGTVLVATNRNFLRFFSGSGIQKYVWNWDGEIVALAAGRDWAMVVSQPTVPVDGRTALRFTLIDTETFEIIQERGLPLRKGASLKWLGFTPDAVPAVYDSDGVLSVLDRARRPRQGRWVPVLLAAETERNKDRSAQEKEVYWPVGASDKELSAVLLKGSQKFPAYPTPVLHDIPLQVPVLRLDVQQGQLEEKVLKESVFTGHRRDGASPEDYMLKAELSRAELEADKQLLLLIQTACKAERLHAALDAAMMLSQPASLDAAAKIAGFFHLLNLQERIELVKENKLGLRQFEDDNKRPEKWSHLVDDRTYTGGGKAAAAPKDLFSAPFGTTSQASTILPSYNNKRPRNDFDSSSQVSASTAPFTKPPAGKSKLSRASAAIDSGFSSGNDGEAAMEDDPASDDLYEEDSRTQKRQRTVSAEEELAPAVAPKKTSNPFAKRAAPKNAVASPSSPAANPFKAKSKSSKATDVRRTGSFFERVEATQAEKAAPKKGGKAAKETGGPKQTTLFGLPAPAPVEAAKKGRKKASTSGDSQDAPTAKPAKKASNLLDSFVKRTTIQEEDEGETQAVLTALSGKPSKAPFVDEDSQMDVEETQVEETQADDTQLAYSPEPMLDVDDDDETPAPPKQSGIAKLQAFAYAA